MQLFAFSFYDSKAQAFTTPFFMASRGQAVRAAIDVGSDSSTLIGRHPEDFHLNLIGVWDDQTARFEVMAPESLGTVAGLLPQQPPLPLQAYHQPVPPLRPSGPPIKDVPLPFVNGQDAVEG